MIVLKNPIFIWILTKITLQLHIFLLLNLIDIKIVSWRTSSNDHILMEKFQWPHFDGQIPMTTFWWPNSSDPIDGKVPMDDLESFRRRIPRRVSIVIDAESICADLANIFDVESRLASTLNQTKLRWIIKLNFDAYLN